VTRHDHDDLELVRASGFGVDCDIYADAREALVSHRNAPLTPTGRLRLARCIVVDGWPVRRKVPGLAHPRAVGGPLPGTRRRGDDRPVVPAAALSEPAAPAHRVADHRAAGVAAAGPGPDRLAAGPAPVDRAQGPDPVRLPPPGAPGPRRQGPGPPLRAGTIPASWFTSTSRNSATSPMAAATAPVARRPADGRPQPPADDQSGLAARRRLDHHRSRLSHRRGARCRPR
jgi:hypothetical protein